MGDITELFPGGETREEVSERAAEPPRTALELQDLVDDIITLVGGAKAVPLSGSVLVDREAMLMMLERLKSELPEELRAARWMVRERETFVARTNEKAKDTLDRARSKAEQMVSQSHIVAEAVEEANALVRRAEGESRKIRLEAEDEVESQYERLEMLYAELVDRLRRARNELHQARPPEPPVPA